jgi:hypothetical protein
LGIFQWADVAVTSDAPGDVVKQQLDLRRGWDLPDVPLNVAIWLPKSNEEIKRTTPRREFTVRSSDLTASDWGYLLGLDILQDRMGQLLSDAYIKVTVEGWGDGTTRAPKADYEIEDLLNCIRTDQEIQGNYQSETRRALAQQLTTYARNPLFLAAGTGLRDLIKPGVLSVIVMNKMSDELRLVLITALVRRIMRARIEASELEKDLAIRSVSSEERANTEEMLRQSIPSCWVAADEAQNFLPSEKRTSAAEILVRLVREGRNYGISFAITTQQPTAIDARIMAQVDTLISHKLTIQNDIEYVRRNLKSRNPDEVRYGNSILAFDDVLRSLDVGQALVSNTEADRTFLVDIRPRVSVHGGF